MLDKLLATVFLTTLGFGALVATASAQERPKCYIIDNSGKLTDLSDLCNVSQKRSPNTPTNNASNDAPNIINNDNIIIDSQSLVEDEENNNQYILGENNFSFDSSSINSSYYIDNEIGMDYTAYLRQYRVFPTSLPRQLSRKQVFQFDDYPQSLTSILRQGQSRVPFIIYRYQI